MTETHFIFSPSEWVGEGSVAFSMSPDKIHFYTKWWIEKEEEGIIRCKQQIQMPATGEELENHFQITERLKDAFIILIENTLIGQAKGKGRIDQEILSWEFKDQGILEGFESYERQQDGDYRFHAEYSSTPENYRTLIHGRLWKH